MRAVFVALVVVVVVDAVARFFHCTVGTVAVLMLLDAKCAPSRFHNKAGSQPPLL